MTDKEANLVFPAVKGKRVEIVTGGFFGAWTRTATITGYNSGTATFQVQDLKYGDGTPAKETYLLARHIKKFNFIK